MDTSATYDEEKWINESNDLIMSLMNMEAVELSIFMYALSEINPLEEDFDGEVILSKQGLFDFFETKSTAKHAWFKNHLYNMQDTATFILPNEDIKGETRHKIVITVKWGYRTDEVVIRFHPDVIPYLYQLDKYTKTSLEEIQKIREKKNAVTLYRFINMNYRQYLSYKDKNVRTKEQLEALKNPTLDEQTARRITGALNAYKRFVDLDLKIVRDAVNTINEADLQYKVTYIRLKSGRKPIGFQFFIEANEAEVVKSKKQKAQVQADFNEKFITAFASPYMHKLMVNMLLTQEDMTNQDVHVKLLDEVYPLYDEIRTSKDKFGVTGEELLDKHLAYIKEKMYSPSEANRDKTSTPTGMALVKYLKKSAKDYLDSQLIK